MWPNHELSPIAYQFTWPQWQTITVEQPLVNVNASSEYSGVGVQYVPGLAANWTISSDATTYTIQLRQNVAFSNGDPFNAYGLWAEWYVGYYMTGNSSAWVDLAYAPFNMTGVNFGPSTISLIEQSGVLSPSAQLLRIMENQSWPIYVTGPTTIVFHLGHPFLWFLALLTGFNGDVYDVQWAIQHGGFGTPSSPNTYFNLNPPPGTGPYMLQQVSVNSYARFTQNPSYWGRNLTPAQIKANPDLDPGHVKNVIIYYKPDDLARFTDLSTGAAQISDILAADWPSVLAQPDTYSFVKVAPQSALQELLGLNTLLYPTNITAVRQAIVRAINYSQINSQAFLGYAYPMMGPEYTLYKDFYNLGNLPPYSYNITLARQILVQNHIDPNQLPTLKFVVPSGCVACLTIAQIVQAGLADLNMSVNIQSLDGSLYYSIFGSYAMNVNNSAQEGNFNIDGGAAWGPNAPDPADAWASFVSNASGYGNVANYYNPVVQKAVDAFFASDNATYIQTLATTAQQQIYNDAPYVSLASLGLWLTDGSLVWKTGVINHFYLDPVFTGSTTTPLFNTVTFG